MSNLTPVRLGAAEQALIAQLNAAGGDAAAERLSLSGLPTRRVEAYHYTDLKMLLRAVPELAQSSAESTERFTVAGAVRAAIVNGVATVPGGLPDGVHASITKGAALTERDDVLVRLNGALAKQTLKLEIGRTVDAVLHIDRRSEGARLQSGS